MKIADLILALAKVKGDYNGRADYEARMDRYASAGAFQTLAAGIQIAIEKLEEIQREEK